MKSNCNFEQVLKIMRQVMNVGSKFIPMILWKHKFRIDIISRYDIIKHFSTQDHCYRYFMGFFHFSASIFKLIALRSDINRQK